MTTEAKTGENLYGKTRWQKARLTHLEHSPECVLCGKPATNVDHYPPHDGTPETFWDTTTWRSLCDGCHKTVTGQQGAAKAQAARAARTTAKFLIPVTVVCGPPGAGKSMYVRERMKWGDALVDSDRLYEAISGLSPYEKPDVLLPYVMEARDALIERFTRLSKVRHGWVVLGGAKREDRERYEARGANLVVLAVDASECIRRISQDPRRASRWQQWEPLVRQWWEEYRKG